MIRSIVSWAFAFIMLAGNAVIKQKVRYSDAVASEISPLRLAIAPAQGETAIEICFTFVKKSSGESLFLSFEGDGGRKAVLSVVSRCSDLGDVYESRELTVAAVQEDKTLFSKTFSKGINFDGGDNYLSVAISEGVAKVYIGNTAYRFCGSMTISRVDSVALTADRGIRLPYVIAETREFEPIVNRVDSHALAVGLEDKTLPVGIWSYFDRDNDPDFARLGGEYQLAVIRSAEPGEYMIVYLQGGKVCGQKWQSGMVKGRLKELPVQGCYRLMWWDCEMNLVESECNATCDGGFLSLNFPLLQSSLRFVKNTSSKVP